MSAAPSLLTPDEFDRLAHVSRETSAKLRLHAGLLQQWRGRVNLVGNSTFADQWRRHFFDSAQLHPLIPRGAVTLVDIGSGAGFPGLVLAAMGGLEVHLVESDGRKCGFLREVAAAAALPVTIHHKRAEEIHSLRADVVTARAVAPLPRLFDFTRHLLAPGGSFLFLKGRTVEDELTDAANRWKMEIERFPSQTDPSGTILRLTGVRKRNAKRR
ncbi:MAG: 16S rRNA (guanine(527)-N(7))-methyltransferase RsmG [Rhodospirillaceae bacterium]|nr:16S rRNA (guanine(527)-N(7))-methyltransferase RsmG [Rhodospirillaceae bacterium]